MTWQPPKPGSGWRRAAEDTLTRISYSLRTIMQVLPGGCLRFGKIRWDDTATGFWLGVDPTGTPRFHIGGAAHALLWNGADLHLKGALETPTVSLDDAGLAIQAGTEAPNWLRFVDGAAAVANITATPDGGPWLSLSTPRPGTAGHIGRVDIFADGDLGESVRLRLETERGTIGSAVLIIQIGNITVATIDATGLHPVNSWTGTFRTDEIATVTVADGIITSVT